MALGDIGIGAIYPKLANRGIGRQGGRILSLWRLVMEMDALTRKRKALQASCHALTTPELRPRRTRHSSSSLAPGGAAVGVSPISVATRPQQPTHYAPQTVSFIRQALLPARNALHGTPKPGQFDFPLDMAIARSNDG